MKIAVHETTKATSRSTPGTEGRGAGHCLWGRPPPAAACTVPETPEATLAPGPSDTRKEASWAPWTGQRPAPNPAMGQRASGPDAPPCHCFLCPLCRQVCTSLTFPPNWSEPSPAATSPTSTTVPRLPPDIGWPLKGLPCVSPPVHRRQTPSFLNPNPSQRGVTAERSLINESMLKRPH